MNPVASCLSDGEGGTDYEVDEIIKRLRNIIPVAPAGGEDNGTFRRERWPAP